MQGSKFCGLELARPGKRGVCGVRGCSCVFPGVEGVMKFCVELQVSVDLIVFRYLVDVDIDSIAFSSSKQFDIVL